MRQPWYWVRRKEWEKDVGNVRVWGWREDLTVREGGRGGAYPRPPRHWTWWPRTCPTPSGCRPDSGHRPTGTWATRWTAQWSTRARTQPSSCMSGRTWDWQSSPPGQNETFKKKRKTTTTLKHDGFKNSLFMFKTTEHCLGDFGYHSLVRFLRVRRLPPTHQKHAW